LKPLALDLCCGKGGWTIGLQAAGWDVIGFDIEAWEGYPGEKLIVGDVRQINGADYKRASLVCASPPCQEFSYRALPFGRAKKLPPPNMSIVEACFRIAKEAEAPFILENVRGAKPYIRDVKAHYGPFYLWGDVPPLLPIGKPTKGFGNGISRYWKDGMRYEQMTDKNVMRKTSSKSKTRKEFSAKAAMIPFELAHWIGECFKP